MRGRGERLHPDIRDLVAAEHHHLEPRHHGRLCEQCHLRIPERARLQLKLSKPHARARDALDPLHSDLIAPQDQLLKRIELVPGEELLDVSPLKPEVEEVKPLERIPWKLGEPLPVDVTLLLAKVRHRDADETLREGEALERIEVRMIEEFRVVVQEVLVRLLHKQPVHAHALRVLAPQRVVIHQEGEHLLFVPVVVLLPHGLGHGQHRIQVHSRRSDQRAQLAKGILRFRHSRSLCKV